jgi:hypothetical protein
MTPFDSEAIRFLQELRPLLLDCRSSQVDRGKRLPQKGPELYDGAYATFRVWWEKLRDYFNINSPSLPTDEIKVQTVGMYMKGNAWSWYHARRGEMQTAGTPDTWKSLSAAIVERFTDKLEVQRDWERMRDLKYEGDIQTYLARLTEINTRVGATGEPFRDIIAQAITSEMHRNIYQKYEAWPTTDQGVIEAVRRAGLVEEEITRSQKKRKSGKEKEKEKDKTGKPDRSDKADKGGKETTSKGQKKADRKGKPDRKGKSDRKDFTHLTRVWPNTKEALKGVDQSQIEKYKADGKPCWRCGDDRHMTFHCIRTKDKDGNDLPAPPENAKDKIKSTDRKKVTAGAKRKQTEKADSSDDEPQDKKPKKDSVNATRAQIASEARELFDIWANESSDDPDRSDF